MKIFKTLAVFCWALLLLLQECLSNPTNIIIGGVLSSDQHLAEFEAAIKKLNLHNPHSAKYNFSATTMKMSPNPLRSALSMCSDMIPKQVYTVVVSHPPNSDQSPISVSYTCGFYKIPVIGITARDSAFSDEKMHPTFLRTVPPYFHQADIWIRILQRYQWTRVIFMHSMDEEGREILYRFQTLADNNDIEIEKVLKYQPDEEDDIPTVLQGILPRQARVILLSASQEDAQKIFREAENLHIIGDTYAWIVTEQALAADNAPEGVLGATLQHIDETQHISDSIRLIGQSFTKLLATENITEAPKECEDYRHTWNSGERVLSYLQKQELMNGSTGRLGFNEKGDRKYAVYDIKNIQIKSQKKVLEIVGIYGSKQPVKDQLQGLEDGKVVWPGGSTEKPKGFRVETKLKVVTIREKPFVYTRLREKDEECKRSEDELDCFHENVTTKKITKHCCKGYCMDLLWNLSQTINFTFELHLADQYGAYTKNSTTGGKDWNGMIKEILDEEAEMIVAPLTINPERAEVIDFSKPFKYQGLTILVKKTRKDSSLASFLQPFQDTLWILVGLSVHVVGLVLYLLDRFSPFGRFKLAKTDDTEEDALNLSSALWFAWGVLLNSGIGEGTPRSFSARVLGMVWAGFAMIIVASYTANLAAFLVLDRPEASITGIDDARLRNPQDTFRFATVKETSVEMYFKRQVELTTMYRTMEPMNKKSVDDAIADIMKEDLQAFIWDSPRLEYEASRECDLITPGELFGRSGLGIGLPKNSLWTHQVSYTILSFHESGFMESLDNKWIHVSSESCQENNSAPATLGLTNMAGVFMMVAGGIVAGVILIFVEIAYKKHRGLKEKELELARNAADRWRGNIEKRKILRQTLQRQREEQMRRNAGEEGIHSNSIKHINSNNTATTGFVHTGASGKPEDKNGCQKLMGSPARVRPTSSGVRFNDYHLRQDPENII